MSAKALRKMENVSRRLSFHAFKTSCSCTQMMHTFNARIVATWVVSCRAAYNQYIVITYGVTVLLNRSKHCTEIFGKAETFIKRLQLRTREPEIMAT